MKTILVTGAAGYIGSHTCVELLNQGYSVVGLDNLYNSKKAAITRVEHITQKRMQFYHADILDGFALNKIFTDNNIDAVIHFAGLKAVGESAQIPIKYYENNVSGSIELVKAMEHHNCKTVVFSSSATVYGPEAPIPYTEDLNTEPCNVYGRTKLMVEDILQDLCKSEASTWRSCLLRYFNPIGAHPTGLIGEDPQGIPNNLMPFIAQVAVGKREKLSIWGNNYSTIDGTGVRDYIHVVDLAKGHVKALEFLSKDDNKGASIFNLGAGKGYSVLEVVKAFEQENGINIPYSIAPRREGDLAEFYANPSKAKELLNWQTELTINDMVRDTWNWQSQNPQGYSE